MFSVFELEREGGVIQRISWFKQVKHAFDTPVFPQSVVSTVSCINMSISLLPRLSTICSSSRCASLVRDPIIVQGLKSSPSRSIWQGRKEGLGNNVQSLHHHRPSLNFRRSLNTQPLNNQTRKYTDSKWKYTDSKWKYTGLALLGGGVAIYLFSRVSSRILFVL